MKILYLEGDKCSPKYVRNTLEYAGFSVEAVVGSPLDREHEPYDAYLLSDYRAKDLPESVQRALLEDVKEGAGLVMVGGWTSLGRGGYAGTPLGDALPVTLEEGDDRINRPTGSYPRATGEHPITRDLPWGAPPVITGYNRVRPKSGAEVPVESWDVVAVHGDVAQLADSPQPVVITSGHGQGRIGVVATDVSPHWSGGWTDWGEPRYAVGDGESVGAGYLRFLAQLMAWAAGKPLPQAAANVPARTG